jgi:hypothetical protein
MSCSGRGRASHGASPLNSVFYGHAFVMNMNASRYVLWPLVGLLGFAAVRCSKRVEPETAAGFNLENLSRLSLGESRGAVLEKMGQPLQVPKALRANVERLLPGTEVLWYARPGADWIVGDYRQNGRGMACSILLEGGKVSGVHVQNAETARSCTCRAEECPTAWANACFIPPGTVHGGAVEQRDAADETR